jgi:hypothetical protein
MAAGSSGLSCSQKGQPIQLSPHHQVQPGSPRDRAILYQAESDVKWGVSEGKEAPMGLRRKEAVVFAYWSWPYTIHG